MFLAGRISSTANVSDINSSSQMVAEQKGASFRSTLANSLPQHALQSHFGENIKTKGNLAPFSVLRVPEIQPAAVHVSIVIGGITAQYRSEVIRTA